MRKGLGEEDRSHKSFASLVRGYETIGKLNSPWWSYDASGEYRNAKTGALLKAKGLRPGKADFEFKTIRNNITHHIYLEFKTKIGRQSPNQKLFENTCFAENEKYFLVRSVQEAINILINENIIIDENISN
jgi:hypothetical protein